MVDALRRGQYSAIVALFHWAQKLYKWEGVKRPISVEASSKKKNREKTQRERERKRELGGFMNTQRNKEKRKEWKR